MGPTLVFSQFQVLLSHLWGFKIYIYERKKRYKGRERRSRTRKKERQEEGVKRNKNNKNNNNKEFFIIKVIL